MARSFEHTTDLTAIGTRQPTFKAPVATLLRRSYNPPTNPARLKYELLDENGEVIVTREANRDYVAALAVPCLVRHPLGKEAPSLFYDSYFFTMESNIGRGESECYFATGRVKYLARIEQMIYPAPEPEIQEVRQAMAAPAPVIQKAAIKKGKKVEPVKDPAPVLQTSLF